MSTRPHDTDPVYALYGRQAEAASPVLLAVYPEREMAEECVTLLIGIKAPATGQPYQLELQPFASLDDVPELALHPLPVLVRAS